MSIDARVHCGFIAPSGRDLLAQAHRGVLASAAEAQEAVPTRHHRDKRKRHGWYLEPPTQAQIDDIRKIMGIAAKVVPSVPAQTEKETKPETYDWFAAQRQDAQKVKSYLGQVQTDTNIETVNPLEISAAILETLNLQQRRRLEAQMQFEADMVFVMSVLAEV